MITIQEKNKCTKNPNVISTHQFFIIKRTGSKTGIPQWKCIHCNKITIAS